MKLNEISIELDKLQRELDQIISPVMKFMESLKSLPIHIPTVGQDIFSQPKLEINCYVELPKSASKDQIN